jgi:hypothetical protein
LRMRHSGAKRRREDKFPQGLQHDRFSALIHPNPTIIAR